MRKMLLILPLLVFATSSLFAETIRLTCKTDLSEHDQNVREQYDVVVTILDDGAVLNIDGKEIPLKQQYDAKVSYYSVDPWYSLQIGNRDYSAKYALGIPTDEPFARYTLCEEVK